MLVSLYCPDSVLSLFVVADKRNPAMLVSERILKFGCLADAKERKNWLARA